MFKKLRQRLSGVLTCKNMARRSENYIEEAMNSEEQRSSHSALRQLNSNVPWLPVWRQEHYAILQRVAESRTRQEQVLNLRRELVKLIESVSMAQPFLLDAFTDEDKRLLAAKLHPDMAFSDVIVRESQRYVFSDVSSLCLRLISSELGDARKNDWFAFYSNAYGQYTEHLYKELIAQARGDTYALGLLAPLSKKLVEGLKEDIFQGANWDYDKEAMERERQEEEALRKARTPSKQQTILNSQIEKLTEFLVERMHRMQDGNLYNFHNHQPSNPLSAITVDTGLILIALCEWCLEDRDTAIDAIREILWRAVNTIAPDGVQGKTKEDLPLSDQIELLNIWEESRDKGSFIGVCIVAAHLLFDLQSKPGDKEHSETVGSISAALVDAAWEVIATTKNVFGWNIEISPA